MNTRFKLSEAAPSRSTMRTLGAPIILMKSAWPANAISYDHSSRPEARIAPQDFPSLCRHVRDRTLQI